MVANYKPAKESEVNIVAEFLQEIRGEFGLPHCPLSIINCFVLQVNPFCATMDSE
jgi:hypothetical protein